MFTGTAESSGSGLILVVLATEDIPGADAHEHSDVPQAYS